MNLWFALDKCENELIACNRGYYICERNVLYAFLEAKKLMKKINPKTENDAHVNLN